VSSTIFLGRRPENSVKYYYTLATKNKSVNTVIQFGSVSDRRTEFGSFGRGQDHGLQVHECLALLFAKFDAARGITDLVDRKGTKFHDRESFPPVGWFHLLRQSLTVNGECHITAAVSFVTRIQQRHLIITWRGNIDLPLGLILWAGSVSDIRMTPAFASNGVEGSKIQ